MSQSGLNVSTDVTVAYNAVRAGTSPWAIFTVTAKDELKLEEKGYKDSTLDDLKEEFSDSKSVELRNCEPVPSSYRWPRNHRQ